jgi:hypothetical protein
MKFTLKAIVFVLYATFCQLCAGDYDSVELGAPRSAAGTQTANQDEQSSVSVQDRLSNCCTTFGLGLPSREWLERKGKIATYGYGATLVFCVGGYFMIQHALDLTDDNYWHEVNNCKKTVGGASRCELAYDSMVWGSIFEFIAFSGFCTTTYCLIKS